MAKTEVIRLRIDPDLKERIFAAAEADDRSASNYIERILKRELDKTDKPSDGQKKGE